MTATVDATPTVEPAKAHAPVASAGATYVGAALSIVLIALGAIAIRDAAVIFDWVGGRPWSGAAIDAVDGLRPAPWLVPAAVIVALVGLVCVVAALKPRKKIGREVTAHTSVYLEDDAVARLAGTAVRAVPGVLKAHVRASRSTVVVRADVTTTAITSETITAAVREALQPLTRQPSIKVRTKTGGPS
ncbi:DUF6286 domain-containing protein [Mycolicibacterium sediminis]|uniref:DUF6286 domain-containing protein n=1 Tax=Mycolicibacterium sediminis TaxID=1286180 RepID=A0A7I7QLZ4_9MYCO|nr:DUF6286 domain-containing protein [Mycolicibacterium sediminis]BBY27388.1 hypothetical protein MSEDJ_14840 [Mycolicibacterium sediminis]